MKAVAFNNPKQFGRVAVMMGGSAAEREVSLKSGAAVYEALNRKGVDVIAIDVTGSPIEALAGQKIDRVFTIGPVPMMRVVANVTRPHNIKTLVSLNPIMVDGTGMCGACRVSVGGKTKFTCVDGPEFDGHEVDFGLLMSRLQMYTGQEQQARELCRCGKND